MAAFGVVVGSRDGDGGGAGAALSSRGIPVLSPSFCAALLFLHAVAESPRADHDSEQLESMLEGFKSCMPLYTK